ncbi:MAG: hypothetical protein NW200_11330, partial [Hyphomonadaceae bacterium]|nr:hypothetical protein [Hyphomonadaceae bacterium]
MTMDADRFAAIVEAYGAAPARWPEAERAAAQAFARAHPAVCRPVLEEAAALDAWLALDARAEPAGEALHARAVAAAP